MAPLSYLNFFLSKGRNLAGRVGLFPQSYTTPALPTAAPAPAPVDSKVLQITNGLQDTNGAPESLSINNTPAPPYVALHAKEPSQGDGEVMKATMTDVQKAIEQLGRNNGSSVIDDARSFSFASTRTGDGDLTDRDTDTDIDIDTDRETDAGGDDWHRDARVKLAEEARKVVEEQRKKEQEDTPVVRNVAPPIEVELSDESEGEDDDDHLHTHMSYPREHPLIPEGDEEEDEEGHFGEETVSPEVLRESTWSAPNRSQAPSPEAPTLATATPIRRAVSPPIREASPGTADRISARSLPTPTSPRGLSPSLPIAEPEAVRAFSPVPLPEKSLADPFVALPSPAPSSIGQQQASKHSSLASSAPSSLQPAAPEQPAVKEKKSSTHPSEWTVDEVVDWLRSKGFGDDVSDKFIGMSHSALYQHLI